MYLLDVKSLFQQLLRDAQVKHMTDWEYATCKSMSSVTKQYMHVISKPFISYSCGLNRIRIHTFLADNKLMMQTIFCQAVETDHQT